MKKVALVSATMNAAVPMTEFLSANLLDAQVINYLDGYLMKKIQAEKGIRPGSIERMLQMLVKACDDGADVILLTCTVFSPYVEHFSKLLTVPILCPDEAMLREVAVQTGRKAILFTFSGTVDITKKMYEGFCAETGTSKDIDIYILPEAYEAAQNGNMAASYNMIQKKVEEIDAQYDYIILAQISMAAAAAGIKTRQAKIYTSPGRALMAIKTELKI